MNSTAAYLPAHVVQVHPLPYVAPGVLDGGVAVNVGEEAEAEPVVVVVGRVGEPVHYHRVVQRVVDLLRAITSVCFCWWH